MDRLDKKLLEEVKQAFTPADAMGMDPGMGGMPPADPGMGGEMPPEMIGGMPPGVDPGMGGEVPPEMMGGMPPGADYGMMGGMPPPMDPGMAQDGPGGSSTITITIEELIQLFKAFKGISDGADKPSGGDPRLDRIIGLLEGAG